MRQLDVELRRFFARRMVRVTVVVAATLVVVIIGIATAKGHRTAHTFYPGGVPTQIVNPDGSVSTFTPGVIQTDTRLDVGRSLRDAMEGTGVALLFAGIALGASFVGAEFNVGSLTTQLLFEPRRWRVHAAKTAATALGGALVTFFVLALLGIAMYAGSEIHGVVHGVDASFVVNRLWEALRITGAVAAGTTFAYAVTLVARRSSAGMMIFFFQYPLLFLLDPDRMPYGVLSHYAPMRGLLAVVIDPSTATGVNERAIHTIAGGVALTALWAVVIIGSAGVSFARSEVR